MTLPSLAPFATLLALAGISLSAVASSPDRIYLSGTGPHDAVPWEFNCSAGRNSQQWTSIPVPSCWETEGFGTYDYGLVHRTGGGSEKPPLADETGHYRTHFTTQPDWRGQAVRLVFDGVFTDTEVLVNGKSAGPRHEGGFYRFSYDISDLIAPEGDNLLEVTVQKKSTNASVNAAERLGDFWTFGGIFRPVWLEVRPPLHLTRSAIDARADGTFRAEIHLAQPAPAGAVLETTLLDSNGSPILPPFDTPVEGEATRAIVETHVSNAACWSAETPILHQAIFRFRPAGKDAPPLHELTSRFGFRTVELRPGDGLYVNGAKVKLRGVNRHCFRPDSGRTLSPAESRADALLLRSLNANAVRTSHYPPDEAFLEACDELGLYVLDELTGWHDAYDTPTGARLVGEMVRRDVNHPSIIIWNNGNERGWNDANDGEFARWDPQGRPVLHPWADFGGIDTGHYPNYGTLADKAAGSQLYMPTEFLHGQYEGGSGAGLADYWKILQTSPTAIGGFLWVLADEGLVRADWDGALDTAGDMAPDGIVDSHHTPNGNVVALQSIWSPLQIEAPVDLTTPWSLQNRHNRLDTSGFVFTWTTLRQPAPDAASTAPIVLGHRDQPCPPAAAGTTVSWQPELPAGWTDSDTLTLTAKRPDGSLLASWSWTVQTPAQPTFDTSTAEVPVVINRGESLAVTFHDDRIEFDWRTGQLRGIRRHGRLIGPRDGPTLEAAQQIGDQLKSLTKNGNLASLTGEVIDHVAHVTARYREGLDTVHWKIEANASELRLTLDYSFRVNGDTDIAGLRFKGSPSADTALRWLGNGPYPVWRNRWFGGNYRVHEQPQTAAAGQFGDWTWARWSLDQAPVEVWNLGGSRAFSVGEHPAVPGSTILPDPGWLFLHVPSAVGTKFIEAANLGPQSARIRLRGLQTGSLLFRLPRP